MIRMGNKRLGIWLCPASNDMSHFFPSRYTHSDFFYLTDDMYSKYLIYTDPSLYIVQKDEALMEIVNKITDLPNMPMSERLELMLNTPTALRLKQVIDMNPQKSLLWQFNAISSDMQSHIRQVMCLGERDWKIWSAFDIYVRFPISKLFCYIMNSTLYFKNKREIAEWDKYLHEIHRKHANKI